MALRKKEAYPVEFSQDLFGEDNETLAVTLRGALGTDHPRALLVADYNVVQHTEGLGTKIGRYVNAHGIEILGEPVVFSGGEKIKCDNLQSAMRVAGAAIDAKLGPEDCILALGGGTLLDVAGWSAAQVRGGVKIVRVPTTPASMMDAAFADTAALDSMNVKDVLRVPITPSAVLVDTLFANTVLDGVWRGGFSEAVRLATAHDASLLKKLAPLSKQVRERDTDAMSEAILSVAAMRRKKGASGLGLWSAVRLESMSGYKLPYGYALAIGLLLDVTYAVMKGNLGEDDRQTVCKMLEDCGAMDGAVHSRHLVGRVEQLLCGLDGWRLATGSDEIDVLKSLGKCIAEPIDRDTMKNAIDLIK